MKNMLRITTGTVSKIPRINRLRLRMISACLRRLCSSSCGIVRTGMPNVSVTSLVAVSCTGCCEDVTCGVALYPTASTFCTICSILVCAGSYVTVACSVAKLTMASLTPGSFLSPFSIRIAQEAQVIPSKARVDDPLHQAESEKQLNIPEED